MSANKSNKITPENANKEYFDVDKKEHAYVDQKGKAGVSVSLETKYIQGKETKNFYINFYARLMPIRQGEQDTETTRSQLISFPDELRKTMPEVDRAAKFLETDLYNWIAEKVDIHKRAMRVPEFKKAAPQAFLNPVIARGDKKDGSGKTDLGMFVSVSLQNIPKRDKKTNEIIPGEFQEYGKTTYESVKSGATIPYEYVEQAIIEGKCRVWFKVKYSEKHGKLNIRGQLLSVDVVKMTRVEHNGREKELEETYAQYHELADQSEQAIANDFADIKINSGSSLVAQLTRPTEPAKPASESPSKTGIDFSGLDQAGAEPSALLFGAKA